MPEAKGVKPHSFYFVLEEACLITRESKFKDNVVQRILTGLSLIIVSFNVLPNPHEEFVTVSREAVTGSPWKGIIIGLVLGAILYYSAKKSRR